MLKRPQNYVVCIAVITKIYEFTNHALKLFNQHLLFTYTILKVVRKLNIYIYLLFIRFHFNVTLAYFGIFMRI